MLLLGAVCSCLVLAAQVGAGLTRSLPRPVATVMFALVPWPFCGTHIPTLQIVNRIPQQAFAPTSQEPAPLAAVIMLAIVPGVAWVAPKL